MERKEEIMKPIEVKANNKMLISRINQKHLKKENKKYNNREKNTKVNNNYKRLNKYIIIKTIESDKTEENKE